MVRSFALALLLVSLAGPAPASEQTMQERMSGTDNPADKQFIDAMRDLMIGMHRNMPTGDTDQDFVKMMVPHHQSAVEMAQTELQYGKDPDLKAMAQAIVTDQNKEIAMMKAWQDKHTR